MKFMLVHEEREIEGETYDAVITEMASGKPTEMKSLEKYRKTVAKRASEMTGKKINGSTSEKLVEGLIKAGLLERIT